MPFWRLYYHLVWSTKNREHLISRNLEVRLYPYIIAKAKEMDCQVYAINGWVDHIHLVISIPPKLAIADVVKRLKGASSHEFEELRWQRGYGALTVGERHRAVAVAYVENQKAHHQEKTVINWLERDDDLDENSTATVSPEELAIREHQGVYEDLTELPF